MFDTSITQSRLTEFIAGMDMIEFFFLPLITRGKYMISDDIFQLEELEQFVFSTDIHIPHKKLVDY